jgi:hypothetical protein
MPVILLGALGGMATAGILGLFVGATLLTLGYQIFMGWVASNPEFARQPAEVEPPRKPRTCRRRRSRRPEPLDEEQAPTPQSVRELEGHAPRDDQRPRDAWAGSSPQGRLVAQIANHGLFDVSRYVAAACIASA